MQREGGTMRPFKGPSKAHHHHHHYPNYQQSALSHSPGSRRKWRQLPARRPVDATWGPCSSPLRTPLETLLCRALGLLGASLGASLGPSLEARLGSSLDCPLEFSWAPLGAPLGSSYSASSGVVSARSTFLVNTSSPHVRTMCGGNS